MKKYLFLLALCIPAMAQTPLQPVNFPVFRAMDTNGKPLSGGKLFSYAAGTTTPLATFADASGSTVNTNPVILDSTGSARVYLGAASYKLVLQNQFGVQQWTVDNIVSSSSSISPTQITGTAVVQSPTGAQTVTQPAGSTLAVNNFNSIAYVNGNGTADNSAAIQAAVTACVASCKIVLVNTVVGAQVLLPLNVDITFTAVGPVKVTTTSTAFYRFQATTATLPISNVITFEGINFVKTTAGIIIHDNLFFHSSTNAGIHVHGCHFALNATGSVGIALSGDGGTLITGNLFDTNVTSSFPVAIETIADVVSSNANARTPMVVTIADNMFRLVVGFAQTTVSGGGNLGEGFTFTGNKYVLATVTASGNEINFIGNEFVGASITLKDLSNAIFTGNYVDSGNSPGHTLLTIDNVIHQSITSNTFLAAGQINTIGVSFQNPRALPTGTTTVNLSGNTYIGANNGSLCTPSCVYTPTGGFGIIFNDPAARNIYVGGENFRTLSAALEFTATLDRSTIESFEARDVFYYAHNIATFAGSFLIAPHLYNVVQASVGAYVPATGLGAHNIASTLVNTESMFPGPIKTMTVGTCTTGATPLLSFGANGSINVLLQVSPTAPVGFASCEAAVTFDGSVYVGPR